MTKLLLVILLSGLVSFSTPAQNGNNKNSSVEPNLSGTWLLDEKQSRLSYDDDVDSQLKQGYDDYVLEIAQKEAEIKSTKSFTFRGKEFSYATTLFTDKRGEQNRDSYLRSRGAEDDQSVIVWLEEADFKSETFWKKGKLIRNASFKGDRGVPSFRTEKNHLVKETYILSEDGKTLTVQIELQIMDSPRNIASYASKLIFRKKDH